MRTARKVASIALWIFFALMVYVTLTAPMIAVTGPAIITIAVGVVAFFTWPRKKTRTSPAPFASSDSA